MKNSFSNIFRGLRVLLTGHTGFKGSWLAIWLRELGAQVTGYSLEPPTNPSNFELTNLSKRLINVQGDVNDFPKLLETFKKCKPQLVFHLAAQSLVLKSFQTPQQTFATNTQGTVNVLEAMRLIKSVKAAVMVTSDKCYENQNFVWGYRENDSLGGHDPYSASKSAAELAIASYRDSFFAPENYANHRLSLSSVRAGNVIGGGDFADTRLIPDCFRALLARKPIILRQPQNIRPWQHVLEALSGYLWLAVKLLKEGPHFAEAWNFGPLEQTGISAALVAKKTVELWGEGSWKTAKSSPCNLERTQLRLNWDKALNRLDWRPVYNWEEALAQTVQWFKSYQNEVNKHNEKNDLYNLDVLQIRRYSQKAKSKKLKWAL
ncbi:MAG TPA: CDP-glucose 4,6-dehydratase [Candidatus Jacksonbacteria bacterium]|nr:MAG: CDP-glucose 4,6-dehydratase [Parcubacteria group bacterium GW2011_GWC2_44_22]OGY76466.1 MAG: CDP-glucose 4,6-dehydratase [Candidatus Jacksonbacteria bacterium RIFOXYB2_FULL_44_15]OGY76837.1 MAG: CDP-glucose 4,6-dehydratase [Candidatus Jacksonbacteria bacterium RIFOXYA2_FULL_43_12]OGY82196.1 MAG: CDP-glucose 4,6-dehydratase [Candidatus Jacksonbacteria bacterium RIFOXYD2_FULL_43_21]HBH45821.1 CDP-glucose 4,6-dehydratase [Candidatus Jacksonbacteria bacterium]